MSRSCEELAVCQGRTPPCTYADGKTVACPKPAPVLRFAPGAIEAHKVGFLGTPAHRRELVRSLKSAAWWICWSGLAGLAAGLITGAFQ